MKLRPTPTFGRAVMPVLGGAALLALILGGLWGAASWMSRGDSEPTERLAPSTFDVGGTKAFAESIADDGPLLFPDLATTSGVRTLVLTHSGTDAAEGWRLYWGYPADRDALCIVDQVEQTSDFTDCNGRTIGVADLAPAEGTCPIVEGGTKLLIGLRPEVCGADVPTTGA